MRNLTKTLVQLRGLDRQRTLLLLEAAFALTAVSAALRMLPFRRAVRLGSVPVRRTAKPANLREIDNTAWSVEAAARRLPYRMVCIHQGLALQRMLRRRGVDARLHYGVGKDTESNALRAHVWIAVNGRIVIGGAEASKYKGVAIYP